MSRPNDIPEDVWRAAREASREGIRMSFQDPLMPMEEWITPYVARAILAERERAAQEAEILQFDEHALAQATDFGRGAHQAAIEIADAIRRGTP